MIYQLFIRKINNMTSIVKYLIAFYLIYCFNSTYSSSLTLGFGKSRPPFILSNFERNHFNNLKNIGIEFDLVKAAFKALKKQTGKKYSFTPEFVSNNRLIQIKQNKWDGAVSIKSGVDPTIFYSDLFVTYQNYAISKKNKNINLNSIKQLESYSILAWQKAKIDLNIEEIVKNNYQYKEVYEQKIQVEMFLKDRANIILIDNNIFKWWFIHIKKKEHLKNNISDFKFHDIFKNKTEFTIGFISKEIRDDFNIGLRTIKKNGEYKKIFDKYLKKR